MLIEKFGFLIVMMLIFAFPTLVSAQAAGGGNEENKQNRKSAQSQNQDQKFEGAVVLQVTFLASGEVGEVAIVSGLNDELNQQAISAARKIKFEPARKDGVAVSVTKKVEYTFFTFYKENDPDLQANAEITRKPAPVYPKDRQFNGISGKIRVTLTLLADGKIEIGEVKGDLPQEFKDKAREAASKIKFKPAIAKNGRKVSQTKEIEYECKTENE